MYLVAYDEREFFCQQNFSLGNLTWSVVINGDEHKDVREYKTEYVATISISSTANVSRLTYN